MINCPICDSPSYFFALKKDRFGQEYKYIKCGQCRFLFDEDLVLDKGKLQAKTSKVYQEDYFKIIDSGWKMRGDKISKIINKFLKIYKFIKYRKKLKVLDYGGGNGYITSKIAPFFDVLYYDKYEKPTYFSNYTVLEKPAEAHIVCAIELIEHITDFNEWDNLAKLSFNALLFTTELSDEISDKELTNWWYLNPDAGHTSIYSFMALYLLAKKHGFVYFFFPSKSFHIFLRNSFLSKINFVELEYPIYNIFRKIKHILKRSHENIF